MSQNTTHSCSPAAFAAALCSCFEHCLEGAAVGQPGQVILFRAAPGFVEPPLKRLGLGVAAQHLALDLVGAAQHRLADQRHVRDHRAGRCDLLKLADVADQF